MGRFPGIGSTAAPNYEAGDWATEGIINNPTINLLLADTGQLAAGIYDFDVLFDAGMLSAGRLQHRNAANSANIKEHMIVTAASLLHSPSYIRGRKVAANERLRVICYANYTGLISVSIIWVRRA